MRPALASPGPANPGLSNLGILLQKALYLLYSHEGGGLKRELVCVCILPIAGVDAQFCVCPPPDGALDGFGLLWRVTTAQEGFHSTESPAARTSTGLHDPWSWGGALLQLTGPAGWLGLPPPRPHSQINFPVWRALSQGVFPDLGSGCCVHTCPGLC